MSSSTPGAPTSKTVAVPANRRQKRMGPAPFASFEDLSDEVRPHLDSPEDKNTTGSVVRLPGIREDITPCSPTPSPAPITDTQRSPQFIYTGISLIGAPSTPTMNAPPPIPQPIHKSHPAPVVRQVSLCAPTAPRIDISRASSSSHHDSKESSPEREIFDAAQDTAHDVKVSLGFREDGAVDLRSSTEELTYQDATDSSGRHKSSHKHHQTSSQSQREQPQPHQRSQSPGIVDDSYHSHQRKDSQSSELGLLCISGRTSRLSSIGSQGSAHSRISTASHLSVISGQSGVSRSPSPHKMLLETSFCGIKSNDLVQKAEQQYGTKAVEPEELEKLILKRQHDPTQAILAEGMVPISPVDVKKKEEHTINVKTPPEKPARKFDKQPSPKSEVIIRVDKPIPSESLITKAKLPRTIIAASGVEYIYIPLKGPMPEGSDTSSSTMAKTKVRETKSATLNSKQLQSKEISKTKSKSASPSPIVQRQNQSSHDSRDEPKYIRIKLKPDYMYSQEGKDLNVEIQKPDSLDLHDTPKKTSQPFGQIIQFKPEPIILNRQNDNHKVTPTRSPKPTRHLKEPMGSSKSPSPSLSRKSSFASLFKSRETMSPESPAAPSRRKLSNSLRDDKDRRRSRSKSRDRDRSLPPSSTESIDSKGKPKSVFSIFKSKLKRDDSEHPNLENLAHELKSMNNTPVKKPSHLSRSPQRFNETQLQGESIRIPLHSPTYYEQKLFLQDTKNSSLDSQETVIEATLNKQPDKQSDNIIEIASTEIETDTHIPTPKPSIVESNRQSSSSSDNIVFSTKLGSSNDLFTTKIPKDSKKVTENGNIHIEMAIVECNKPPSRLLKQDRQEEHEAEQEMPEKELEKVKSKPSTPQMARELSFNSIISRELSPSSDVNKGKDLITSKSREEMENLRRSPVEKEICRITTIEKIETPKTIHKEVSKPTSSKVPPIKEQSTFTEIALPSSSAKVPTSLDLRKSFHDDDYHCSSESERESDKDFKVGKTKGAVTDEPIEIETERKGLVMQQDSFEDEFPYVPTTLPQERSVAVPIVPVKQRSTFEMKTCPIERPRSSTPINPSCLEDYCEEVMGNIDVDKITKTIEKLKISLPKEEGDRPPKTKSPRRTNSSNWFDFSAMGIQQKRTTPQEVEPETVNLDPTAPPLPPKGVQKEWINFEEIPERRKPPKRIQTIPSRGHIDVPESTRHHHQHQQQQSPQLEQQQQQHHQVIYTYVNPEDCKCECHELKDRQRHHHHRSRDRERDTRDRYNRDPERCEDILTPDQDRDMERCSSKGGHCKVASPVSGDDSASAGASDTLAIGAEEVCEDEMPLLDDEADVDVQVQSSTSGVTKLSTKGDGQLKFDVTVVNRRSLVSESSVDLSANVEQPGPIYPDAILRTPFTSDLGISSNRSSILSQDESQSPPESQSPNAFTKST